MGNIYYNSNEIKKEQSSACPLINQRKIIKENTSSALINGISIINYKNKEFILLLLIRGTIEIYDSNNLELVSKEKNPIENYDLDEYVGNLLNEYFVVVGEFCKIYIFYEDNINYKINLVQKIRNNYTFHTIFLKAFAFDRNLYREKDIHEIEIDKKERKKNKNYKNILSKDEELVINSTRGIKIYKKNIEIYGNYDSDKNINIDEVLKQWNKNPYIYYRELTEFYNYDIVQVNFKYLAGTIKNYLCLYSMEEYELITKFQVKVSEECDCVIFMLKDDLLCIGGKDTISLISIKDFEIVNETLIKPNYKITEICILPDLNILIGLESNNEERKDYYLYQYKYYYEMNKSTEKKEHKINEESYIFLTKSKSNIMMRCLSKNRIVIIEELKKIQILE